ncbi:MAG: hypothetical protein ISQ32_01130, partial [Rickettsiales bacterium]|nr:hypothetical protein [Rickettsiales bacterium]
MIRFCILILLGLFAQNLFAQQLNNNTEEDINKKELKHNFLKTEVYNYSIEEIINKRSLLFNPTQLKKLDKVRASLILGELIAEEEIFDKKEVIDDQEVELVSATRSIKFYLNSIIYINSNRWIVWINGNKYNQDTPGTDEFQIVDVSSKKIKLKWVTGYSTFVYILNQAIETNKIPETADIKIVDDIANVSFELKINQTFLLSKEVTIKEGRYDKTR